MIPFAGCSPIFHLDAVKAGDAILEGQLGNSRQDVVAAVSSTLLGRQDAGSALHAGATVGARLAVLHLAGGLAFLFTIAATFAVQLTLQTPAGYVAQGLLLLGLALVASGLVYLDRRALARLAERLAADLSKREAELDEIANRDDLTQLGNRRFFYAQLQEELQTSAKTKRRFDHSGNDDQGRQEHFGNGTNKRCFAGS